MPQNIGTTGTKQYVWIVLRDGDVDGVFTERPFAEHYVEVNKQVDKENRETHGYSTCSWELDGGNLPRRVINDGKVEYVW